MGNDEKISGAKVSDYLRNMNQKNSVAKVIYKNELRTGNLSSTAGLQHIENRYNGDHFWLVDHLFTTEVAQKNNQNVSEEFKNEI